MAVPSASISSLLCGECDQPAGAIESSNPNGTGGRLPQRGKVGAASDCKNMASCLRFPESFLLAKIVADLQIFDYPDLGKSNFSLA